MHHYGTLREFKFTDNVDDIRGAELYGENDEKLGTIDDVIFDHSSGDIRYVVVDTGGWLTSSKFLVPANRISPYGREGKDFYASLDKERIKQFPEYDEDALKSEDKWANYENRYEAQWDEGPVLHKEGGTRIITPEPQAGEFEGNTDPNYKPDLEMKSQQQPLNPITSNMTGNLDTALPRTRQSQDVERSTPLVDHQGERRMQDSGHTHGRRWTDFQERLRDSRNDVVSSCGLCAKERKVA
jgi:sporulation protein YlmC with PRC-barrel domain